MKYKVVSFIFFLWIFSLFPADTTWGNETSDEALLNNIDAMQAVAIANQWKWVKKDIKSYVTPAEVVFKFSDKKVKRIPLPEDRMIVAVAPYIRRTHK